jgi:hypothetical protein
MRNACKKLRMRNRVENIRKRENNIKNSVVIVSEDADWIQLSQARTMTSFGFHNSRHGVWHIIQHNTFLEYKCLNHFADYFWSCRLSTMQTELVI